MGRLVPASSAPPSRTGPLAKTEVEALGRSQGPLGLPRPAYEGRSLPNLTSSVLRARGTEPSGGDPVLPPLAGDLDPFHGRREEGPLVVLLVDAFGWYPFAEWAQRGPDPTRLAWGSHARPITTVFPTTTPAALTSLSTAAAPAQHGLLGASFYVPALGQSVDSLRMSPVQETGRDVLVTPDWRPAQIAGLPAVFARGLSGVALTRYGFIGSGFNRILYEGAELVGFSTASDEAHLLASLIERPGPAPTIFAYWDELDTVHHLRGPKTDLFDFEADRLVHLLSYVAERVGPRLARSTTVVVTADHGQVEIDPAAQVRVDLLPTVSSELRRPMTGDRRAGFFTARPGRAAALGEALVHELPAGFRVVPMEDAIRAGLFGPAAHHPELEARLGDFLVLPPAGGGLLAGPPLPNSRSPGFLGSHSGLAPEELLVPLVSGSLADLARPGAAAGQP